MDDFFSFSKNLGFWVFLVHPTVVLVLVLSASVERCFVSRMRDFVLDNPTLEQALEMDLLTILALAAT